MYRKRGPLKGLALLVAWLAPLALLAATIRFSVNVPYQDEWEWADLAYHAKTGTLTFSQIYAAHNEHRNTIPNLVFLLFDRFGSWNILYEQLFSVAVIVAGLAVLWRLTRRRIPGTRGAITFAAISLLVCGFGQWENLALGYNIGWNICTSAAFAVVALLVTPSRSLRHVVAAAAVATIASFSSGQGLLMWPVGLAAIALVPRYPYRTASAWLVVALVVIGLYYTDYHNGSPVTPARPNEALACLQYTLALLGTPLRSGSGVEQATDVGGFLLAALLIAALPDVIRRTPSSFVRNAPWYALALYALLGAAFTAASRVHLGLESAMASRYFAIAVFLPVAIIGLVATSWPRIRPPSRVGWRFAFTAGIALMVGMEIHGLRGFEQYAADRHAEIRALRDHGSDLKRLAYPYPTRLAHLLDELRIIKDGPYAPR